MQCQLGFQMPIIDSKQRVTLFHLLANGFGGDEDFQHDAR